VLRTSENDIYSDEGSKIGEAFQQPIPSPATEIQQTFAVPRRKVLKPREEYSASIHCIVFSFINFRMQALIRCLDEVTQFVCHRLYAS